MTVYSSTDDAFKLSALSENAYLCTLLHMIVERVLSDKQLVASVALVMFGSGALHRRGHAVLQ